MIHGERTRLHPGTVCILSAPGRPFDGDMCVVEKYDSARSKWQVRLRAPEHNSKQLLVPEAVMRLAFCILPSSITLLKRHAALRDDAMQGSCGRGFILGGTDIIEKGTVLYEEPPLFITPTGTPNQHNDRWRAYLTMSMSATQGQIGMPEALKAFDDLGIADRVQDSVAAAASNIVNDAIRSAGASMSVGERELQVQRVRDALMRFQSNQFRFENSAVPDQSANFSASAIFILTSRLNHACQPNTFVDTKKVWNASCDRACPLIRALERRLERRGLPPSSGALLPWEHRLGRWHPNCQGPASHPAGRAAYPVLWAQGPPLMAAAEAARVSAREEWLRLLLCAVRRRGERRSIRCRVFGRRDVCRCLGDRGAHHGSSGAGADGYGARHNARRGGGHQTFLSALLSAGEGRRAGWRCGGRLCGREGHVPLEEWLEEYELVGGPNARR